MTAPSWTPHPGETIHLNSRNRWHLPAGRYRLDDAGMAWLLFALPRGGYFARVAHADLIEEDQRGPLTPIDPAQIERDRVIMDRLFGARRAL